MTYIQTYFIISFFLFSISRSCQTDEYSRENDPKYPTVSYEKGAYRFERLHHSSEHPSTFNLSEIDIDGELDFSHFMLKSVIYQMTEKNYDPKSFDVQAYELSEHLSDIKYVISFSTSLSQKHAQKMDFLEIMYATMTRAARLMEFYESKKVSPQAIIYKVVQLRLRLLAFFESDGSPLLEYSEKIPQILLLNQALNSWKRTFDKKEGVSLGLSTGFYAQFHEAKSTIFELTENLRMKGGWNGKQSNLEEEVSLSKS